MWVTLCRLPEKARNGLEVRAEKWRSMKGKTNDGAEAEKMSTCPCPTPVESIGNLYGHPTRQKSV